MKTTSRFVLVLCALAIGSPGCDAEDPAPSGTDTSAECTVRLTPSANDQVNVQTALIEAGSGSVLCFDDGTYHFTEELELVARNIKLRGTKRGAVWDFKGQLGGGNGLSVTGDGFVMEDLWVKNTKGDGVRALGVDGVTFRRVKVTWDAGSVETNGAYAVYPIGSRNVLVENCEIVGASDAGVYVGQSSHIIVRNNLVHGNVAGIEIENSVDADVYNNHSYDNTAGILVFNLPGLPVKDGRRTRVFMNLVENNNRLNFAGGGIVAFVPSGLGFMLMANDETEVFQNTIRGNESTGLLAVSYQTTNMPFTDTAYDPYGETLFVHDNVFTNNGGKPAGLLLLAEKPKLEDILWDGRVDPAKNNADKSLSLCLKNNGGATYRNVDAAGLFRNQTTDPSQHDCTHPPLAKLPFETLAEYKLFTGTGQAQEPAAGVLPYSVAAPLFADFSGKHRFVKVPANQKITYQPDGVWQFPSGTILVKTFSYLADERNPAAGERMIETRLLIKDPTGWTAHTYLWTPSQSQADARRLVAGTRVDVTWIDAAGTPQANAYRVPNIIQCGGCHGTRLDTLGLRTRQMNRDRDYGAGPVNQIDHMASLGLFTTPPQPLAERARLVDPSNLAEPLEERARSYLDANCAHCHNAAGAARTSNLLLNRETTSKLDLGVCRTPVAAGRGAGGRKHDIVPGKPDESIMIFRVESTEPDIKMPEMPTALPDPAGARLLRDWIMAMTPEGCPGS